MIFGSICPIHPELEGLKASDRSCARCKSIKINEWKRKKFNRAPVVRRSESELKAARRAKHLKYQLAKINRVPPWANLTKIKEIYTKAQEAGMDVDHIIPLRGEFVSGLHVENNLQLLSRENNLQKGNKHVF